jgi:hypothetical protein
MAAAADLGGASDRLGDGLRPGRLTHGIGKVEEVVFGWGQAGRVWGEPNHFPASRCTELLGVQLAQVIGMWLGIGSQRTEYGGLVGVDIRKRRY